VIEDISNKLLQQFVTCLQDKVGGPAAETEDTEEPQVAAAETLGDEEASAGAVTGSAPQAGTAGEPSIQQATAPTRTSRPGGQDDALDLGATVVPVLARTYGPAALVALVALVVGYLLGRRHR
jgi:hypothetical protein